MILNDITLSFEYEVKISNQSAKIGETYYYWLYYSYLSCYIIFSSTNEFNSTGISLSYKHTLTHSSRKIYFYI